MNKKHYVLKLFAFLLVLTCFFSSMLPSTEPIATADSQLDDLQQQYDDLEKEIEKNEKELAEIESEKKETSSKLNTINNEINSINSQISILNQKISLLESEIATLTANIEDTNKKIAETEKKIADTKQKIKDKEESMEQTKNLLLGRIRENYMVGEASTIEILFSSDDLSSYFERQELMNRVSEGDAKLIKTLTADINELNQLKAGLEQDEADLKVKKQECEEEKIKLEEEEADLQASRDAIATKKAEVDVKQRELQNELAGLSEDSEEYKAIIKRQRAEREELSAQIDAYIKEHGSSVGDTPDVTYENDGKMMWPVTFASYVSCAYGYYSDGSPHWGIDICKNGGGSSGQPFVAAQGGKVILAKNDGGWNYGFGNYCVIDHGDGKQTLYAHSSGLRCSVNQVVKKGQTIGAIGATGNVTGPHLHFEVRIKQADGSVSRVNPMNYVKNTTA